MNDTTRNEDVPANLPSGPIWVASQAAHRKVWAIWRGLLPVAAKTGVGVSVTVQSDHRVVLETVYAPLWTAHQIVVSISGEVEWCGEQCAPVFDLGSDSLPWLEGTNV